MLFDSLFLSALMAVLAISFVALRGRSGYRLLIVGAMLFVAVNSLAYPYSLLFWLVAGATSFVWAGKGWSVRSYVSQLALFFIGSFGIGVYDAFEYVRSQRQLREEYPLVSLRERLPVRKGAPVASAPPHNAAALQSIETSIWDWSNDVRSYSLKQLHSRQVDSFVSAPGFGFSRMLRPGAWTLNLRRELKPPPQPGPEPPPAWSPGEAGPKSRFEELVRDSSKRIREEGVVDFAFAEGFGYMKDLEHVAGFLPHRARTLPKLDAAAPFSIDRIYLIGLVVHSEPTVYVTDTLPSMENVKSTPTRPTDAFELAGIEALKAGEESFVRGNDQQLRMLGAIRAGRQCLDCHAVPRGSLLGAFSYYLSARKPVAGH